MTGEIFYSIGSGGSILPTFLGLSHRGRDIVPREQNTKELPRHNVPMFPMSNCPNVLLLVYQEEKKRAESLSNEPVRLPLNGRFFLYIYLFYYRYYFVPFLSIQKTLARKKVHNVTETLTVKERIDQQTDR